MTRGSPQANIVGGIFLLLIDAICILRGRLPLKGRFDAVIDVAHEPRLFWAYAASLGTLSAIVILFGLWGLRRR